MIRKRTVGPEPGHELAFADLDWLSGDWDEWTGAECELFNKFLQYIISGDVPTWWIEPSSRM